MNSLRPPPDPNEADEALDISRNAFYYFVEALLILAGDAEAQCRRVGDYNVAWELLDDVSAGAYLAGKGVLTPAEETAVNALVDALAHFPRSDLINGAGRAANLADMQHAAWIPLRMHAAQLHEFLLPAIERNNTALGISSGAT